ncbi:MAG TPA: HD-GYP domain-containing protein [Burkholderiales bacterium]|nr:HD-GYP domain-containing protein [Burkholderiales bacterium]
MYKKQIAVEDLELGMYVIELDRPWLGTSFAFQGFYLISPEQIEELRACCKHVFIDTERERWTPGQRRAASPGLQGSTVYEDRQPVESELVQAQEVFVSCEEAIRDTLESLKREAKLDADKLSAASHDITESMERNPDAILLLNRLHRKSTYELRRAMDSSITMIAFGRFLQFAKDRLEILGLAGMLLDVGKVKIPDEVLNKAGMLSADEYQLMKSHVEHSVTLVREVNGKIPEAVHEIILQHHERQDGSGYPRGLKGDEISVDGSIAAIADSFSALTSDRCFAEPMAPSTALSQLHAMRGKCFHEALVEQFIQCVGIYPVGSAVEMNTGEIGIVMAQNPVRRLQPRVMLVLDRERKQLPHPQVILDLMREPRSPSGEPYRIRRTLPMDRLPIDPNDFFIPWMRQERAASGSAQPKS